MGLCGHQAVHKGGEDTTLERRGDSQCLGLSRSAGRVQGDCGLPRPALVPARPGPCPPRIWPRFPPLWTWLLLWLHNLQEPFTPPSSSKAPSLLLGLSVRLTGSALISPHQRPSPSLCALWCCVLLSLQRCSLLLRKTDLASQSPRVWAHCFSGLLPSFWKLLFPAPERCWPSWLPSRHSLCMTIPPPCLSLLADCGQHLSSALSPGPP